MQPPSGGCVLKLGLIGGYIGLTPAAAFGRLCVETKVKMTEKCVESAAAFGRLCVETLSNWQRGK